MIRFFARILLTCLLCLPALPVLAMKGEADLLHRAPGERPWRILHVMSYQSSFAWSDEQFSGFKAGLGRDVQVEYQVLQLDALRVDSPQEFAERARSIRRQIAEWNPDLLYASDDAAVDTVLRYYANTALPCVFSGLRQNLRSYGLAGARNITGVQEQDFFVESVRLLQQINPRSTRIHLISDLSPYRNQSIERIRKLARTAGGINLVGIDSLESFSDFQQLVLKNPKKADAYLLVGNSGYRKPQGERVSLSALHRWLDMNSKVPEITFRSDRVKQGALVGVITSGHDQGFQAGVKARKILIEGQKPGNLPVGTASKGVATINLARARALGLMPRANVLLSSVVNTDYEWSRR